MLVDFKRAEEFRDRDIDKVKKRMTLPQGNRQ